MIEHMRPALAGLALACAVTAASAQNVVVYLFDRLEQPSYARAWAAMLGDQQGLPYWLVNRAKRSTQGAGHRGVVEGHDVEFYRACQPHNCSASAFAVMFTDRDARAKSVLIIDGGTPRFFGRPDAAESAALRNAGQWQFPPPTSPSFVSSRATPPPARPRSASPAA